MVKHVCVVALVLAGCSSPGPYGYARTYVPSDAEQGAERNVRELDLVMAKRRPDEWTSSPVSAFVVVSAVGAETNGVQMIDASIRRLQKRNLCRGEAETSCRVTVSERGFGRIRVSLRSDAIDGTTRIQPGSLLRVIGKLRVPAEGTDDPPTLSATFHRHWPSDEYVTTALRKYMRR